MAARASTSLMVPVLLAAVALAGCVVGPDYRRPEVGTPGQFRSQIGPAEARSIADLPWWQVFNDRTLQKLITQALTSNYNLKVAIARIEQAQQLVGVARSDLYPQVGYGVSASRQKEFVPFEQFGNNITFNAFGAAINAAWEFDLWGRIRRSTEAAEANLLAQEDVRRGVMLSLVSEVATAYFQLIEFDRELAIAQDSANTYKKTLDLFTQRYQSGRDSRLPVVRAQASYDSSSAAIASLTRAIAQQENALSVLLGSDPRAIERGIQLVDQTVPPTTPVGLTTDLLQRRPDILEAEHVMMGANAQIGVAVANYFPVIGLAALFGSQAPHVDDLVKSSFSVWSIGASLTGPIFQGGRLRATYHAQQAFWDETIAQYKQTILVAFQETSNALIAQQTLAGQRAALQNQVNSLRQSVDLALERYNGGRATYFEVLEAEQQLFPSENALAQTQRDQLLAVVNLYKALGGGWNLKDADWEKPQ